jgi:hypothetical protein
VWKRKLASFYEKSYSQIHTPSYLPFSFLKKEKEKI